MQIPLARLGFEAQLWGVEGIESTSTVRFNRLKVNGKTQFQDTAAPPLLHWKTHLALLASECAWRTADAAAKMQPSGQVANASAIG
jgi:hypothetical protein